MFVITNSQSAKPTIVTGLHKTDRYYIPVKAEEQLGVTVRHLREGRNLSVRTLASLTGFSASFISQVETGQASPSIASLERIANGLGVSLAEFFQNNEAKVSRVVRRTERARLESGWSKGLLEKLTASSGSQLSPVLITIQPQGASAKHVANTSREEFAFVVEGAIVLTLDEEEFQLEQGDSVTILANTARRWRNDSDASAQVLVVASRH